jgi:hypothetical protein
MADGMRTRTNMYSGRLSLLRPHVSAFQTSFAEVRPRLYVLRLVPSPCCSSFGKIGFTNPTPAAAVRMYGVVLTVPFSRNTQGTQGPT